MEYRRSLRCPDGCTVVHAPTVGNEPVRASVRNELSAAYHSRVWNRVIWISSGDYSGSSSHCKANNGGSSCNNGSANIKGAYDGSAYDSSAYDSITYDKVSYNSGSYDKGTYDSGSYVSICRPNSGTYSSGNGEPNHAASSHSCSHFGNADVDGCSDALQEGNVCTKLSNVCTSIADACWWTNVSPCYPDAYQSCHISPRDHRKSNVCPDDSTDSATGDKRPN